MKKEVCIDAPRWLAWVYTPKESSKNKLVPRSEQMTFIGYDMGAKAYRFMCKDNVVILVIQTQYVYNNLQLHI